MWITYFQCQLHLTNLLARINHNLSIDPDAYLQSREYVRFCNDAQTFVDDLHALIPFMLVGEGILGNKPIGSIWLLPRPPMLIGGLSLQWILFTISILDVVSANSRLNAKTLLLWIGKNLGIGQATVLAQVGVNAFRLSETKLSRWTRTHPAVLLPKEMPLDGQDFCFEPLTLLRMRLRESEVTSEILEIAALPF